MKSALIRSVSYLLSFALSTFAGSSIAQVISTIAGGGRGPYIGDRGPAVGAYIEVPISLAFDSDGNLFVGQDGNRIRKVSSSTGVITTYVGNTYTGGANGDGGPAFDAAIGDPIALAVDLAGNLYLADGGGGGLRKVDATTGIINRVFAAEIGGPSTLVVDAKGDLLVGESNRIKKVNLGRGTVSAVAGNGTNVFSGDGGMATNAGIEVAGMAVDSGGNIFFSSPGVCKVRKISAATGIISTVAGSACEDFSGVAPLPGNGDGGPATAARLWPKPTSLALDRIGHLYISSGEQIRKVDVVTGVITTFAGRPHSPDGFFNGDGFAAAGAIISVRGNNGLAFDRRDNMYVADWHVFFDGRIRKISGPDLTNATGLWWNESESGWGVNISHQGSVMFATLFTYGENGLGQWFVMSNGSRQGDGSYSGDLYQTTGPAFNATPFAPISTANFQRVGKMTLVFGSDTSATLAYDIKGKGVTKKITQTVFRKLANCTNGSGDRSLLSNFQDLWWNPQESGWGVNITHQENVVFATLFTYDETGAGLWLVMSDGLKQEGDSYLGELYRTTGSPFNAQPFRPITSANFTKVGTMHFKFSNGVQGTLEYSVNGVTVVKQITRLLSSSPVPHCM